MNSGEGEHVNVQASQISHGVQNADRQRRRQRVSRFHFIQKHHWRTKVVHTRLDISYSVGVNRFMERPNMLHYNNVKRLLWYIKGTLNYGVVYHQGTYNYLLRGYSDSDHAGSVDDRKSMISMVFYLNENLIT